MEKIHSKTYCLQKRRVYSKKNCSQSRSHDYFPEHKTGLKQQNNYVNNYEQTIYHYNIIVDNSSYDMMTRRPM